VLHGARSRREGIIEVLWVSSVGVVYLRQVRFIFKHIVQETQDMKTTLERKDCIVFLASLTCYQEACQEACQEICLCRSGVQPCIPTVQSTLLPNPTAVET
jgi:hypothetical protein